MSLTNGKRRWALLGLAAGIAVYGLARARAESTSLKKDTTIKVCAAPDVYINPIASQVYEGGEVTLTWTTPGQETVVSNFGASAPNGSISKSMDALGQVTFTVTATSTCDGRTATASRTTNVVPPPPPPPPPPPRHRCFVAGTQI